jgi:hypothetical protein
MGLFTLMFHQYFFVVLSVQFTILVSSTFILKDMSSAKISTLICSPRSLRSGYQFIIHLARGFFDRDVEYHG